MSENNNTPVTDVSALACAAIKKFLVKAVQMLPPGMEAAKPVYQTLDAVLEYLGRSAVDGGDRTITISVRHLDADEVSINVTSTVHLPPQGDIAVSH